MNMAFRRLLLILLVATIAACSGPDEPPAPTPTPTPEEWLARALAQWQQQESFHFLLALEGRTIPLDESGLLAFDEVEGDVVVPDRVQAETTIRTALGSLEAAFIAIGEEQWLTNPLNDQWEPLPPDFRADLRLLFDPEVGISSLVSEVETLTREADETINGRNSVHLNGTLPGEALGAFAPDMPETVTVDLWVDAETAVIHRVLITEPRDEPVTWQFDFSEFDAMPSIEPPVAP